MTKNPSDIPWEEKNVKYIFPGGHIVVEEVATPWDLFLESKYVGELLGSPTHQIAVQHGLERIFSIRQAHNRLPLGDILTRPIGARCLLPCWEHVRVLQTSNTVNIDGQDLLFIEVLRHNKQAPEQVINWARTFFVGRGGILGGEHPSKCVLTDLVAQEKWIRVYSGRYTSDLLCGNAPENFKIVPVDFSRTTQVLDIDEALVLMQLKYFKTIYLDLREMWVSKVLDHLWTHPGDKPKVIFLFPSSHPRCKVLLDEARRIMK